MQTFTTSDGFMLSRGFVVTAMPAILSCIFQEICLQAEPFRITDMRYPQVPNVSRRNAGMSVIKPNFITTGFCQKHRKGIQHENSVPR